MLVHQANIQNESGAAAWDNPISYRLHVATPKKKRMERRKGEVHHKSVEFYFLICLILQISLVSLWIRSWSFVSPWPKTRHESGSTSLNTINPSQQWSKCHHWKLTLEKRRNIGFLASGSGGSQGQLFLTGTGRSSWRKIRIEFPVWSHGTRQFKSSIKWKVGI